MPGTARGCLQVSLCLSVTQDLLSTFGLDLLFLEGGFLRKSVSDFSLFSHGRRLHAAQVCCWESGWGARTWRGDSTYPVVTLPHLCPLLTSLWCLTSPLHSVCPVSEIHKCIHPHHRCEARQTCSGEGSPLPPKKKPLLHSAQRYLGCAIQPTPSLFSCFKGCLSKGWTSIATQIALWGTKRTLQLCSVQLACLLLCFRSLLKHKGWSQCWEKTSWKGKRSQSSWPGCLPSSSMFSCGR